MTDQPSQPTAAMIVIGDEILSGRTKDRNAGHLAERLDAVGIALREIRVVPDETSKIVEAVDHLRRLHTYIFTSGGIGPTHDDITADAIARAFERPLIEDPRAIDILEAYYARRELPFTPARRRMTRMPEGAGLIENRVSAAPGFIVDNVHVMAGVPSVFEAMLDAVLPTLKTAQPLTIKTIAADFGEGTFGDALAGVAENHPEVSIGSYPRHDGKRYVAEIVIRGRDQGNVDAAMADVRSMLENLAGVE
ncbi:molybdopterin-binding protein [Notoacmeibacter sp. MSK16QG-6]|uniref:competence/damage-inducible protein A n=1 Tax=Notoacmeibacter sp. MSK16QG-6 TaxID=2957982 RepID=UPI00209C7549|nr:molybdopterin-binding protein [Notoacmeibacter sp. MSK16QG-6]MCP1199420.1 molybdopterin-binding protein [Notoacmeibacter sp. MSK16QG-6]